MATIIAETSIVGSDTASGPREVDFRVVFTGNHIAKGKFVQVVLPVPFYGSQLLAELAKHVVFDPSYHDILFYNSEYHGWEYVKDTSEVWARKQKTILGSSKGYQVDIMIDDLYQRPVQKFSRVYSRFMEIQNSGPPAFAIGIFQGKTAFNTVNLRKVATQLGADFVFVIHPRYRNRKPLEQSDLPGCVPYIEYLNFNDFASKAKEGWVFCGIEMDGEDLVQFEHPRKAIYILGAEDNGLPMLVQQACRHIINIPSVRSESFNVTCAGSIVMYDRVQKQVAGGQ